MTRIADLAEEWMKDPAFRAEYEALAPEFAELEREIVAREEARRLRETESEEIGAKAGEPRGARRA